MEAAFDEGRDFRKGWHAGRIRLLGYIDKSSFRHPFCNFRAGLCRVWGAFSLNDNKMGFIRQDGSWAVEPKYDARFSGKGYRCGLEKNMVLSIRKAVWPIPAEFALVPLLKTVMPPSSRKAVAVLTGARRKGRCQISKKLRRSARAGARPPGRALRFCG